MAKTKKDKKKSSKDEEETEVVVADTIELTESKKKKTKKKKKESSEPAEGKTKPKSSKSKSKSKKSDPSSSVQRSAIMEDDPDAGKHPLLDTIGWKLEDEVVGHGTHGNKYAITGNESQVLTVALQPGETCLGEPGVMMYLSPNVGLMASCAGCCTRCLSGEDCCVMNFTHSGLDQEPGYAALTPNEPLAKVIPVEMSSPAVGGCLIVQKGAYMASYGDVNINISCDTNFCRCCCGGMGLIRQKLEGSGTAFLGATGTIVQKVLAEGETLVVDTQCLLAYSNSCTFDLKRTGGVLRMVGGGEGIFNSTITGPGLCIVQSMNQQLLLDSLAANKMYRR
mmetsp:Transcript_58419/g.142878  ORF Transcript_58419/g.142878 Transcript_58419/m.142878 type:complete len:337 (-) Transcript_58419:135-1145(-)